MGFLDAVSHVVTGFFRIHFFVGIIDFGHQVEVRNQFIRLVERIADDPSVMKRLEHGLINDAAQLDQIIRVHLVRVFLRLGQAKRTPVNRVRFRQPPVERTPFGIHFFREHRINLVFFAEQKRVGPIPGGLRMEQCVKIRSVRAEKRRHFLGPLLFEIHVCVVEVLAHFVLKESTPDRGKSKRHPGCNADRRRAAVRCRARPSASGRENP